LIERIIRDLVYRSKGGGAAVIRTPGLIYARWALAIRRQEMQGKTPNEEKLTEDEIARRKLGPRGVPGGEDSAKMTPQQKKNLPKEGEFDGHVA
jgi:hypothetical protein